jgi:hypothetical protein|tara:strand:- start:130 stop:357 length:228 start_codon:yes stop_codon:yes gene_type:complete
MILAAFIALPLSMSDKCKGTAYATWVGIEGLCCLVAGIIGLVFHAWFYVSYSKNGTVPFFKSAPKKSQVSEKDIQ